MVDLLESWLSIAPVEPGVSQGPDFRQESWLAERLGQTPDVIAGIDEVGRGALAGPVVAAAVALDPESLPAGLNDSKKLSAKRRTQIAEDIRDKARAWAIGSADVTEIERLNIWGATKLAMKRALENLNSPVVGVLVDGKQDPGLGLPTRMVIQGDGRSMSIAAASILAKVFRDDLMADLHQSWPDYGWERNAGYGVPAHMKALRLVGYTKHHRKGFKGIREILDKENLATN